MLLVMSTAGIFHDDDAEPNAATSDRHYTALWQVTWERIDCFLPNLKRDLFLNRARASSPSVPAEGKSSGEQADKGPVNAESSEETVTITVVEDQASEGKTFHKLHSQKRFVASCQFYRLVATCQQVTTNLSILSSCKESVKIRLVATCHL